MAAGEGTPLRVGKVRSTTNALAKETREEREKGSAYSGLNAPENKKGGSVGEKTMDLHWVSVAHVLEPEGIRCLLKGNGGEGIREGERTTLDVSNTRVKRDWLPELHVPSLPTMALMSRTSKRFEKMGKKSRAPNAGHGIGNSHC